MRFRFIAAAVCGLWASNVAQATEIRMLASGALKESFFELIPKFENVSGNKVVASWAGTEDIKKRVAAGEAFDLVIIGAPVIDAFTKEGKIVTASRVDLGKSGIGLAVKAGAPKPDISSGEAVKKALVAATVVAYSTGSSGVYVRQLFDKLGIAEQMKAKSKQAAPNVRVSEYLAKGEADLGFQQVSELVHEKGIDFLGPLPADIQNVTVYASAILVGAKAPEAANALQTFLATPTAAAEMTKNGIEPVHTVR